MENAIPLTGLYKQNRKRDGAEYLSGKLNYQTRLLVLPNDRKQADNEPDYNVFLVPIEPKEGQQK